MVANAFDCGDVFDEWNKKTRVVYLGARDLGYQRQPALIYEQVVFAAELATISRISARLLATCTGRCTGSVNASSIPHDLVVLAQPSKNCLVDALPDASFHPFVEPAPTSHATAGAEFAQQVFQAIPVLSTNRMPVKVARALSRGRPPFGDLLWVRR